SPGPATPGPGSAHPRSANSPAAPAPTSAEVNGARSWATPAPAFDAGPAADTGYDAGPPATPPPVSGGDSHGQVAADGHGRGPGPGAESPAAPAAASDAPSGYAPAPVSFVSEEDEEYSSKPGYGGYDRDRTGEAPGWKDSGRAKPDKVFDVNAGRRRPVVFEEEDDLDVPDFLK
ncbi:MAG TPA: hypothetical protein VGD91_13800, partial [Trebonia sp.]